MMMDANAMAPNKKMLTADMQVRYTREPDKIVHTETHDVHVFDIGKTNIDEQVVHDFGEEWLRFNEFSDDLLEESVKEYFDVLNEQALNKNCYAIDIGCGTGRWTKYLSHRSGFIEAVDPSNSIFAAAALLKRIRNVRLTQASIETLPFEDETFDFGMSIGVLHHVPDTRKALADCVRKIKKGGFFYLYIYYNLENKGPVFKLIFSFASALRLGISRMPTAVKKMVSDAIAILIYMPLIYLARMLNALGLNRIAKLLPLNSYVNKNFYIVRNDALDRFGTRLEHRFSKAEVEEMMAAAGLTDIVISDGVPYYHAIGRRS